MNIIVAVYSDWGIGCNGSQPIVLREDRRYFKVLTSNAAVIAGRRTLEDFPAGGPLPHRTNVILSRNPDFYVAGAVTVHTLDALFLEIKDLDPDRVFVIGGESVYTQLIPYCSRAYVTKIRALPESDAFFLNLDDLPNWNLTEPGSLLYSDGIAYSFDVYENLSPLIFTESEDYNV